MLNVLLHGAGSVTINHRSSVTVPWILNLCSVLDLEMSAHTVARSDEGPKVYLTHYSNCTHTPQSCCLKPFKYG